EGPGEERTQAHAQPRGGAGGRGGEAQGGEEDRVVETGDEVVPAQRQKQRGDRQQKEGEQDCRRRVLGRVPGAGTSRPHPPVPRRNPNRASVTWPAGESRKSANSRASSTSLACSRTATGYSAMTFS